MVNGRAPTPPPNAPVPIPVPTTIMSDLNHSAGMATPIWKWPARFVEPVGSLTFDRSRRLIDRENESARGRHCSLLGAVWQRTAGRARRHGSREYGHLALRPRAGRRSDPDRCPTVRRMIGSLPGWMTHVGDHDGSGQVTGSPLPHLRTVTVDWPCRPLRPHARPRRGAGGARRPARARSRSPERRASTASR